MAERALIIGASGLVGGALRSATEARGWEAVGTAASRAGGGLVGLDIREVQAVRSVLNKVRPSVVFLCAAYASVDGCETDPERARAVNVEGVRHVASAAAEAGAVLVYYSTDYVFDGVSGPYFEDAAPAPVSVYGRTKLEGERVVSELIREFLVVRTTAVYGWDRASPNFAMQVWSRLSAGERLRAPEDQVTTPTLAGYLAEVSLRLVEAGARGVVNVAGRDRLSRAEFARRLALAFALDPELVEPVTTAELGQRAARPLVGGLRTDKLQSLLGTEAMALDEALKRVRRQWRADTYVAPGRPLAPSGSEALKREILDRVREYHRVAHASAPFEPMRSRLPYAGRVYGAEEMVNLVEASLDFWLTLGPWGDRFEQRLKARLGARDVALVNSGSSANLAAVTALMSPLLPSPLRPGDEVITPAVTFPTTIAPLLQNGLVPVLVDCELGTYNVDPAQLEAAISPRTRAIMIPHTLGNPCDMDAVMDLVRKHHLYCIEDSCDALGSRYRDRPVGTFGDLATLSFYPAHHITMGEGGAVIINRPGLSRIVRSVRDWGRDCWCAPGESNTCGKRFGWQLGELPAGYDHKYVYSQPGYNLKPTDLQAAIGVAQLDRLDDFVARRRANFDRLYAGLRPFEEWLLLPRWDARATPSWFGFPITVREGVSRRALVQWLEDGNIETRELFGGSILKQPGFREAAVRVAGELRNSERVLHDTFFVGVFPGISPAMAEFVIARFAAFFKQRFREAA